MEGSGVVPRGPLLAGSSPTQQMVKDDTISQQEANENRQQKSSEKWEKLKPAYIFFMLFFFLKLIRFLRIDLITL